MVERIAYFFVYHGSRDARSAIAATALAERIFKELNSLLSTSSIDGSSSSSVLFRVGALELAPEPLHHQLCDFSQDAAQRGIHCITVLPLFLLPGTHVQDDIPAEVSLAQQMLGSSIQLRLHPHMGSHPQIANWLMGHMSDACMSTNEQVRIFVSHGSKKAGSHQPTQAIANALDAISAYWLVAPSLEQVLTTVLTSQAESKIQSIWIIPYFLFAGKITDAIVLTVQEYQHRFPEIRFQVASPIGENETIAAFIAKWLTQSSVAGVS